MLAHQTDPEQLDDCEVCQTLLKNLFQPKGLGYKVQISLQLPVIGIGAPISYFLPGAAKALGAETILPNDADVANAIGAITSNVVVKQQVRIVPHNGYGFRIEGLPGSKTFNAFAEADAFARDALIATIRDRAVAAGTSRKTVELFTKDLAPVDANGWKVFMARHISATLIGPPDMVPDHENL